MTASQMPDPLPRAWEIRDRIQGDTATQDETRPNLSILRARTLVRANKDTRDEAQARASALSAAQAFGLITTDAQAREALRLMDEESMRLEAACLWAWADMEDSETDPRAPSEQPPLF